jgi:hypothetical protein
MTDQFVHSTNKPTYNAEWQSKTEKIEIFLQRWFISVPENSSENSREEVYSATIGFDWYFFCEEWKFGHVTCAV